MRVHPTGWQLFFYDFSRSILFPTDETKSPWRPRDVSSLVQLICIICKICIIPKWFDFDWIQFDGWWLLVTLRDGNEWSNELFFWVKFLQSTQWHLVVEWRRWWIARAFLPIFRHVPSLTCLVGFQATCSWTLIRRLIKHFLLISFESNHWMLFSHWEVTY